MKTLQAILACVNGSSVDAGVVELAVLAAKRNKIRVNVVYVIEVSRTLPLTAELDAEMDKGERYLEAAESVAAENGYRIETEILQARDAGSAVVDEAVERACDLIVMGVPYSIQRGSFDIGHAASYVLKNSPVKVWLVRGAMSE